MNKKNARMLRQPVPELNTDPERGLTASEAEARRQAGWHNLAPEGAGRTEGEIILRNLLTFFNLVFVVLAAVLLLSGSSIRNCTFMGVVLCNLVIGCVQEIRAKRAVDKLSLLIKSPVRVLRDGEILDLQPEDAVRDDIAEFSTGDPICADGVVCTGSVQVNESLLTGESDAVEKHTGDPVLSGSFVISGRARVRLTAVGGDSFAAKLAAEAKADPRAAKSEMMTALDRLIRVVGIALIPVGLALFHQEYRILKLGLTSSAEGTVAALVGMIPEGLYLLTSIAMAASALKLAKKRVLVQDMNCIEALARVDVLCVDKTGTITENTMEAGDVIPLSDTAPEELEEILAALYHGRDPENDTDRAMAELFGRETGWRVRKQISFTSASKWRGTVFEEEGAFLSGAPEAIMGSRFPEIEETVTEWTGEGYRVLLVAAYRGDPVPGALRPALVKPLALVLLTNPIRPEARETFAYFASQGVDVRILSGDNPATAARAAARAGIENTHLAIDAGTLQTDEDYRRAAENTVVFGRVTPEQKKKIVEALRENGHTVAMTGDGVNDLLAMKQADCSVAMAGGARAASQVASLVLLNSNFSGMPHIVEEGRRVINNIQRAAALYLVKNIFSLGLALISLLTGFAYPLVPFHLTVVGAFTIGIPSFFLALEPNYERVTGRFLPGILRRALPGGITDILMVLTAQTFAYVFSIPTEQISPVCAAILAVVGLLVLFQVCRPFGLFRKIIWGAMAAGLVLSFTLFGNLLGLRPAGDGAALILLVLLLLTVPVFFAVEKLFSLMQTAYRKLKRPE